MTRKFHTLDLETPSFGRLELCFPLVSETGLYVYVLTLFCLLVKVPLVVPFDKKEFKDRVESVKIAILAEMDRDLAHDMRSYDLAGRRHATCAEMLPPQMEKAASTLGILGF